MDIPKWTEIVVECESEYIDPVSQLLQKFAIDGIVIEESYEPVSDDEDFIKPKIIKVKAYIPISNDNKDSIQYIDIGLTLFSHLSSNIKFNYDVTDSKKWLSSWRKRYRPLKIGQRVIVVPSWIKYKPQSKDLMVLLDPGQAFGTGYHPTTRMCIELLDLYIMKDQHILDFGTGSGILSIVSAKYGLENVVAIDIDPVAIEVALENSKINNVQDKIAIIHTGLPYEQFKDGSFDLVLANISAKVIKDSIIHFKRILHSRGKIILSGFFQENMIDIIDFFQKNGFLLVNSCVEEDWGCLCFQVV